MFVPNSPEDHQPLCSAPPARDILHFSDLYPNQSDWPLLSMSSPRGAEIMPQTATPQSALWLECGSAPQRHFQIWKGEGRWLPCRPSHESDCVSRQIKGKGDADGRAERSPCWRNQYKKWRMPNCLPSASLPFCAPLQVNWIKEASVNDYDWLDLKIGVIARWSTELSVFLRAIKTSIVFFLPFNSCLTVDFARFKVLRLHLWQKDGGPLMILEPHWK